MCNEPLDDNILETLPLRSGMNFDQQMKFCVAHRKISAGEDWKSRGYPDIDWQELDSRMVPHYPYLKAILEGKKSHFGDLLSKDIAAGKNRTLKKTEERLVPGYYGLRGLTAMSENIINEFSALLRSRSVQDRTISARGYTSFVQVVMVPELAVRLIMEDMKVEAEAARVILRDSMALGTLLNEEIADVVLKDRDTDDEDSGTLSELSDVESVGF